MKYFKQIQGGGGIGLLKVKSSIPEIDFCDSVAWSLTPFKKIYSRNAHIRKAREAYLIDKYQLLTRGLNRIL